MLLKTKATVKLAYTKWRILEICCIFLYFQLKIRALFIDFETHVFIRFLISIKFSIAISHKKREGGGGGESRVAPRVYIVNDICNRSKFINDKKIILILKNVF